ncbi:NINE protein [Agromyces kandeliae]|uniref:NINE protein n=1 Tax=Agromyces kandeliae TaxID=2666141 RepID=A0A6L5R3E0_9MICO|nr:NINE protein [Agromyces kandeliae]MRX44500.1 NINE protein [Agromyces kandeliae]
MSDTSPAPAQPPAAGWYPEPETARMRWWDGTEWGPHAPNEALQEPRNTPAAVARKERGIAYLLLILLGGFGAHHFYLRNSGVAFTQLAMWLGGWVLIGLGAGFGWLFVAGIAAWLIVDLFQIPAYVRAANGVLR